MRIGYVLSRRVERLDERSWQCMSVSHFFQTKPDSHSFSLVQGRTKITDLSRHEMGDILYAAAARTSEAEITVRRAIAELNPDAREYYAAPLIWSLMWIGGSKATPDLIEFARTGGAIGCYAVAALQRLWFRKTPLPQGSSVEVADEWQQWYLSNEISDWNEVLENTLIAYGVTLERDAQGKFEYESLIKAWEVVPLEEYPIHLFETDSDAISAVQERTLIGMRLSELLCERTGIYSETPAAFPRGFPDGQWYAPRYYGNEGDGIRRWRMAVFVDQ